MPDWLVTTISLKPASSQSFQSRACAGENIHVLNLVQIIFFHDQRAIAVDKYSSVHLFKGRIVGHLPESGKAFGGGLARGHHPHPHRHSHPRPPNTFFLHQGDIEQAIDAPHLPLGMD